MKKFLSYYIFKNVSYYISKRSEKYFRKNVNFKSKKKFNSQLNDSPEINTILKLNGKKNVNSVMLLFMKIIISNFNFNLEAVIVVSGTAQLSKWILFIFLNSNQKNINFFNFIKNFNFYYLKNIKKILHNKQRISKDKFKSLKTKIKNMFKDLKK